MGPALGSIYNGLRNEIIYLHLVWGEYKQLFGAKPQRVRLLNEAAGSIFRVVQDTMWERVLIGIARLADRPEINGKQTLTIRRLISLVPPEISGAIRQKIDHAIEAQSFARDWRNRRIAHNSLDLLINPKAKPLAPATRLKTDAALAALADVMNTVSLHFAESQTSYEHTIPAVGDALTLLHVVNSGVRARSEQLERIRTRTHTAEDLKREEL